MYLSQKTQKVGFSLSRSHMRSLKYSVANGIYIFVILQDSIIIKIYLDQSPYIISTEVLSMHGAVKLQRIPHISANLILQ